MSDLFDKTKMCWERRRKFLNKHANTSGLAQCLVWVQGQDGKVFGATISLCQLGENGVKDLHTRHGGLLWWPQSEE